MFSSSPHVTYEYLCYLLPYKDKTAMKYKKVKLRVHS